MIREITVDTPEELIKSVEKINKNFALFWERSPYLGYAQQIIARCQLNKNHNISFVSSDLKDMDYLRSIGLDNEIDRLQKTSPFFRLIINREFSEEKITGSEKVLIDEIISLYKNNQPIHALLVQYAVDKMSTDDISIKEAMHKTYDTVDEIIKNDILAALFATYLDFTTKDYTVTKDGEMEEKK